MLNIGDEVIIEDPYWHEGINVGGRLGQIMSTKGYILVNIYDYENNPVKCFRSEVRKTVYDNESGLFDHSDEEIDDWVKDLLSLKT